MARQMFYTLQETAERLGVDEQAVKEMASQGKLQQFRDREQLMFKRDEVEAVAGISEQAQAPDTAPGDADDSGEVSLSDSGLIPLADDPSASDAPDSSDSGAPTALSPDDTSLTGEEIAADDDAGTPGDSGSDIISLADEPDEPAQEQDPGHGTGVSVFDADEVEPADPTAQTQVNRPAIGEEEAALENIGSGSGLLDLTRESDDTSLGAAELLDEIYPGEGEPGGPEDSGVGVGTAMPEMGSSGVLEATQAGPDSAPELEAMQTGTRMDMEHATDALGEAPLAGALAYAEPYDPAGSGLTAGMMIGALAALVIGMLGALGAMLGVQMPVIEMMTESQNALFMWLGGLLALTFICGGIGWAIGRSTGGG